MTTALTYLASAASRDRYIHEITKIPLLTRDEELSLAKRFRDHNDLQAAHHLVVSNLRFVVKVAHEYRGYGFAFLDLIQEGNIGLMHAVKKFNPERGYRLITYAVWWIRDHIQSFILRSWSLVRIGTGKVARRLFFKLRSTISAAEKEAETGEYDQVTSLASKRLGVSKEEISEMETRLALRDYQLDANVGDEESPARVDYVAAHEPDQEELVSQQQEWEILNQALAEVKCGLDDKEQYILEHRLLQEEPETLTEVGKRFGVTRQRIQQIEGKIIGKIRQHVLTAKPSLALFAAWPTNVQRCGQVFLGIGATATRQAS